MAKTQEELNALKEEVETSKEKLRELTKEELEQVNGGQTEESVILAADEENAKDEAEKMKKLQSKVIASAGTMSVMIEIGKEVER